MDTAPAALDAYSIWLHARSAVTSAQYPDRLTYTIAVSGLDGEKPVIDHYRASADPGDGAIRIFPISNEELAKPPPVPHGIKVNFSIELCIAKGGCTGKEIPIGHPAPNGDILGEPLLEPTYMFGLRYKAVRAAATSPEVEGSLRVIAIVSSGAPDYSVSLIDTPLLDGVPTYHLELMPLRKPKQNRLRELWIGTSDYLPRKAIVAGNFTLAPLVDVPWSVDFSILDGAPYITRESAGDTLYLAHRRVVREATIAFEDIQERSSTIYDVPLIAPDLQETMLVEPGP
ncbi:MAG TPA: hypothetical protein VKR56_01600 [Candidatus Cybelea sp.]|nr:hypothetical protein [Candidatus Cybelea sp.]